MHCRRFVFIAAIFAPILFAAECLPSQTLQDVLSKMDAASKRFHSSSADVEFSSIVPPIPDPDVQKGAVYYERDGATFQGGVHIDSEDGKPAPKVIVCCAGHSIKLFEKLSDQVTTLGKLSQYEDWFMLGFGAGGTELAAKWDIKYDGAEAVDGIETAKLELTPKDPKVKEKLPKVILWMDPDRAISLKQYFDEGGGASRTCHYTNIKLNQPLPKNAFTFATDKNTNYINR
jgi:outer membrane lipoprotein-sorting protein